MEIIHLTPEQFRTANGTWKLKQGQRYEYRGVVFFQDGMEWYSMINDKAVMVESMGDGWL